VRDPPAYEPADAEAEHVGDEDRARGERRGAEGQPELPGPDDLQDEAAEAREEEACGEGEKRERRHRADASTAARRRSSGMDAVEVAPLPGR
jgi:hypothetical protein